MTNTNKNYKWDLESIYPSFHVWEEDYGKLIKALEKFTKYQGKVSKQLLKVLIDLIKIERLLSKLYLYAKLNYDLNCLDETNNIYYNKALSLYDLYSTSTSFVEIEILNINDSDMERLYNDYPELKDYKSLIEKIRVEKEHYLTLKEEELLAKSGTILDTNSRIFDKINDADCDFGFIEKEELTHGNYGIYIKKPDQKIREQVFTQYHEYYKKLSNTISECLITQVKGNILQANIRKFTNPLAMYLNPDKVNTSIYENLIKTVRANIILLDEYLEIRKNELNLDKLHMYDLYVPLNQDVERKYTYEEAKEIVLNSLKPMGNEYLNIAKNGLDNNWVDVYPTKGKTSGAYSSGCYDSKPYILMNFNETLRSVETLAHELGHSMHSYYSRENNPYHYSDYSIFLAEIASNTHELLLFDYLLKNSNDVKMNKRIIETILDSFKGSIFRQTQFAEFEKIIHDQELNNNPLTSNKILDIYYELNNDYYGRYVVNDELIKYECLRIPHFYSSFYVYKYAIGLSIAYTFAKRIINEEENAVENYLKFISSGSSKYPLEVLKDCGIDLDKTNIVEEALNIFNDYLEEYKDLMNRK